MLLMVVPPMFFACPAGWTEALVVEARSIFIIRVWWHHVMNDRRLPVVLSFLVSWVVHGYLVSHVLLFISSFCHAIFLPFDLLTLFQTFYLTHCFMPVISGQHIPEGIHNFKTRVVCPEFWRITSMLTKRWF
jgi:hypothetical protein